MRPQIGRSKPCEDKNRGWNEASTRQGISRIFGSHQKLEERHEKVSLKPAEATDPADTLISASKTLILEQGKKKTFQPLRLKNAWCILETERRPVWLKLNKTEKQRQVKVR